MEKSWNKADQSPGKTRKLSWNVLESPGIWIMFFCGNPAMVPFLCETPEEILRSIINMFISATTMKNANTLLKLLKIDINFKAVYKSGDGTDVGMAAKIHVSNYKKAPGFKNSV